MGKRELTEAEKLLSMKAQKRKAKLWEQTHPEKVKARHKRYKEAHPEVVKAGMAMARLRYKKAWHKHLTEQGRLRCVRCGFDEAFAAIDFHHVLSETKETRIALILICKITPKRITEVDKTVSLCANCHRTFHSRYGNRGFTKEHLDLFLVS